MAPGQLRGRSHVVLDATRENEQAGVLTCVERIWGAGSGSKAESVGLIVITRTIAVERPNSCASVWPRESGHERCEPSFLRCRTSPVLADASMRFLRPRGSGLRVAYWCG